jgi:hypothetical protein
VITRIDPPLPLDTPKGRAWAYFILDYAIDFDLLWICFVDETRECWTFSNREIRIVENQTIGRIK